MRQKRAGYIAGQANQDIKLFEGEKWLVVTALLGFLLAGVCAVWALLYGGPVAPKGNAWNAFSFNAALGVFMLSTAAIAPLTRLGGKSRAFFRWSYIVLALYSYFAETVQNLRGVNPRFVKGGSSFDVTVGSLFTFVALLLILYYLYFAVPFFRSKAYRARPEMVLGIRYAMLAILLSFAAGVWISFNNGRIVGASGNLIWLHGLGFHALQAVPCIAWLAERSSLSCSSRRKIIHLSGWTYLLGLIVIGLQTYTGQPVLEWSLRPIIAAGFFLISLAAGIIVLRKASFVPLRKQSKELSSATQP